MSEYLFKQALQDIAEAKEFRATGVVCDFHTLQTIAWAALRQGEDAARRLAQSHAFIEVKRAATELAKADAARDAARVRKEKADAAFAALLDPPGGTR